MENNKYIVGLDLGLRQDHTGLCVLDRQMVDETGKIYQKPEMLILPSETSVKPSIKGQKIVAPKLVSRYDCQLLQRIEARSASYIEQVERVCGLFMQPELDGATLVPDWTGVGIAVVEMLKDAKKNPVRCPKCKGTGMVERTSPVAHLNQPEPCMTCEGAGRIRLRAKVRPVYITAGTGWSADGDGFKVSKHELIGTMTVLFEWRPSRLTLDPAGRWTRTFIAEAQDFKRTKTSKGNETYEAWREKVHDDLILCVAIATWFGERANKKFWMHC